MTEHEHLERATDRPEHVPAQNPGAHVVEAARREIVVAATINAMPFMLGVDANSPYQGLGDLTAALAAKKGKASYAYSSAFGKVIAELYKAPSRLSQKLNVVEIRFGTLEVLEDAAIELFDSRAIRIH